MPPSRHHLITARVSVALLVMLVMLKAVPAAASWGRLVSPAAGDTLVAGYHAPLRWSALPTEVDEFELLLSIDGGRSFPIRLTPQLDPALREYVWRVPNLPAASARLRLRVGIGGREIEGPPGECFAIVATSCEPIVGLAHRDGEVWLVAEPRARAVPEAPERRASSPSPPGGPIAAVVSQTRQEPDHAPGWTSDLAVRLADDSPTAGNFRGDCRPAPLTPLRP